jgi:uncharacterized membrane protein YciS (DUF1049 family)
MPRAIFMLLVLLVFLLGATLVAVNAQALRVDLLLAAVQLTAGQWLLVSFVLGWIAGVVSAWRFVRRLTGERADLRRRLRLAEAELRNLRPVAHDAA